MTFAVGFLALAVSIAAFLVPAWTISTNVEPPTHN